ncbi:N-acetylmuramoyl-L-alanine amidase [Fictibacillus enclensis]|uniref:N-acetylmuramoyl-L-alanine amidase n=1 Tax=Fictibacillus enclensis TaxID=1017270 RepID=UPI0025A260B2|nr:N-acetylmuramoyl-L-alanine amidase [Fictibacillus enclensis]MDM5199263.1 N-acetylmuramoyl-L-alanine amidase [Fictibacillus enclensis]
MAKASDFKISRDAGHGLKPQPTAGKRTPKLPKLDNRVIFEREFNEAANNYFGEGLRRCGFKEKNVAPELTDVPLSTRVSRCNTFDADLHVSFHFNALGSTLRDGIGGIETLAGSSSTSKKIAAKVQAQLIKATGLRDRGVRDGSWLYLNHTKSPLVLVECGFMDIQDEAVLMIDKTYQKKVAEAVLKAVCDHFNVPYVAEKKEASKPAPKPASATTFRLVADGKQVGAFNVEANAVNMLKDKLDDAKEVKITKK